MLRCNFKTHLCSEYRQRKSTQNLKQISREYAVQLRRKSPQNPCAILPKTHIFPTCLTVADFPHTGFHLSSDRNILHFSHSHLMNKCTHLCLWQRTWVQPTRTPHAHTSQKHNLLKTCIYQPRNISTTCTPHAHTSRQQGLSKLVSSGTLAAKICAYSKCTREIYPNLCPAGEWMTTCTPLSHIAKINFVQTSTQQEDYSTSYDHTTQLESHLIT